MTVYLELVQAAATVNYKLQLKDQSDEVYIKGLAFAIGAVNQEVFDKLSRQTQAWYQQMTEVIKLPFDKWPKIPGFKDHTQKIVQKPIVTKKAGVVKKVREIVIMDPTLTARQVHKLLDATSAPGVKFEIVSVIVSETKSFIVLSKELGFWRDKSIYEGQAPLSVEEAQTQFPEENNSVV